MPRPTVIIHGGFFSESTQDAATKKAKQDALINIVRKTHAYVLEHSALEAVVFGSKLLEDNPLFNAGLGSQIQKDGRIRMSASLMDGTSQKFSGVINIERIKNPIELAALLQGQDDKVLSGTPALEFARRMGFADFDPEIPERRAAFERKMAEMSRPGTGTVGCVALDAQGRLAAATSTGGKGFEVPGRVSDSATTAGNFCNTICGVSCTGVGEDIMRVALASSIAQRVKDGMDLDLALKISFAELKPFDGFAGAIALTAQGQIGFMDSHPTMVYAHFNGSDLGCF